MKYGFIKVASAIPAVKVGDVIFNTQQIEEQNRADIGFLPVLVVSNRRHYQHQHQDGGNGFQCADEQSA